MRLKFDIDPSNGDEIERAIDILEKIAHIPNDQAASVLSSAVAAPSQTVLAATPDNTSVQAQHAFGQNAASPASSGSTVAHPVMSLANGVDVDSRGLPYDARIHSVNKTKAPSGEWRTRRGISDALVNQVEAELKAAIAAAPPVAVVQVAPAPVAPVAAPPAPIAPVAPVPAAPVNVAPPAPQPPVAPAPPPPVTPVPLATGDLTFVDLLKKVSERSMTDNAGTQLLAKQALATVGLAEMQQLIARPDLVMSVARAMGFVQ